MQDTARGIVHSFVDHVKITNTNHPSVAILLRRIAAFYYLGLVKLQKVGFDGEFRRYAYSGSTLNLFPAPEIHHLPDPGTIDGAIDLITLCFLMIFGNVLDFRTYCTPDGGPVEKADANDVNNISIEERYNMCVARGTCIELLRWWNTKYSISTTEFSYQGDFTTHFLVSQALALWIYKFRTEEDERPGAPGCTRDLLLSQIRNVSDKLGADIVSPVKKAFAKGCFEEVKLGFSRESLDMMKMICLDPPREYGDQHFF